MAYLFRDFFFRFMFFNIMRLTCNIGLNWFLTSTRSISSAHRIVSESYNRMGCSGTIIMFFTMDHPPSSSSWGTYLPVPVMALSLTTPWDGAVIGTGATRNLPPHRIEGSSSNRRRGVPTRDLPLRWIKGGCIHQVRHQVCRSDCQSSTTISMIFSVSISSIWGVPDRIFFFTAFFSRRFLFHGFGNFLFRCSG